MTIKNLLIPSWFKFPCIQTSPGKCLRRLYQILVPGSLFDVDLCPPADVNEEHDICTLERKSKYRKILRIGQYPFNKSTNGRILADKKQWGYWPNLFCRGLCSRVARPVYFLQVGRQNWYLQTSNNYRINLFSQVRHPAHKGENLTYLRQDIWNYKPIFRHKNVAETLRISHLCEETEIRMFPLVEMTKCVIHTASTPKVSSAVYRHQQKYHAKP